MENNTLNGHIQLLSILAVGLVLPLALILLSYAGVISGLGNYVVAFAVIASIVYVVGGGIWMFFQDKADAKTMENG